MTALVVEAAPRYSQLLGVYYHHSLGLLVA